jgi:serine/threonine protein kinase
MPRCPACSGDVREDPVASPCPHCGVTLSRGAITAAAASPGHRALAPAAVPLLDRALSQLGPVDDARFPPGRIFASRYRIVSFLGRGAMGEVYRADDLRLGQAVALKLMPDAIAHRHDGLRRLTDEVRLARGIAHPNVCRVYDIGYAEGWHFLSMEYVDGETLASLFRRIGQLPMPKAVEMARQLCAGVGAAHARGVLHRDLKPSNIMVDGRGQIRVMDFGLAVAVTDDVREVAGTPAYMSPEQLDGSPVTVRSDVYSLGRVLNEILPSGIDPEVSTTIQACLSPDPSKRPVSAYAVAAVLPRADSFESTDGAIPSPAMVAAAPAEGALVPAAAWLLLAAVVGGSIAIAAVNGLTVAPAQLPKPPEVLAERAREILAETGNGTAPATDHAFWWWAAEADDRIRFTYRESSALLIPANLFRVVTVDDPAHDPTRMRMVTLEADGTPGTAVETPRSVWSRQTGGFTAGELLYWLVIVIGFAVSGILARRNLRAGEGDRNGAWRLGLFVGCGGVVVGALRSHYVPSVVDELSWLLSVTGWSVMWGGFSWLAYISFEPYGRRWWPHTLVSWTRLLAGRVLDPLVGHHVLVGSAVGVLCAALTFLDLQVSGRSAPLLLQLALGALGSSRGFVGLVVFATLNAVTTSLCGLALLVFFRLILRSTWAASAALIVLVVPIFATGTSPYNIAVSVLMTVLGLVTLFRVGLVAHVAMLAVMGLMTWFPLTLDRDAWYFGQSLIILFMLGAMASYGFLAALGGRPAFGTMEPR